MDELTDVLAALREPIWATPTWRAAVQAAGGGHCDQRQDLNDLNLQLAEDGQVYCPRCFTAIARALTLAGAEARARAAAERYTPGDLLSLLDS